MPGHAKSVRRRRFRLLLRTWLRARSSGLVAAKAMAERPARSNFLARFLRALQLERKSGALSRLAKCAMSFLSDDLRSRLPIVKLLFSLSSPAATLLGAS